MKPLYLEFVNTGIANRFDFGDYDLIEMNKNLKKYPKLFYSVLMHELGHDIEKNTIKDFWHDMTSKTPGLFSFMRKHISSWTQILPFYWSYKYKTILYDWSKMVDVIIIGSVAYSVYWVLSLVRWIL